MAGKWLNGDWIRRVLEVLGLFAGVGLLVRGAQFRAVPGAHARFVLGAALLFGSVLVLVLEWILWSSTRRSEPPKPLPLSKSKSDSGLDPAVMLKMEFEYARITASEAMSDRHTVVNFQLLLTGFTISAVVGLLGAEGLGSPTDLGLSSSLTPFVGVAFLWTLCLVDVLYLLKIIRLRQAWQDSAETMSQIKEFYLERVARFSPQEFSGAFRWRKATLPAPAKKWTIFFLSAVLIALLSGLAYVVGGTLLGLGIGLRPGEWLWVLAAQAALGLVLVLFNLHMYGLFLERNV